MDVDIRFVNVDNQFFTLLPLTSPLLLPAAPLPTLTVLPPKNLGTKLTPTANKNATNAVLKTSDNNTVRKLLHTDLDTGARYVYSTGESSGRSNDTAKFDGDIAADDDTADSAKFDTLLVLSLIDKLSFLVYPFVKVVVKGVIGVLDGENAVTDAPSDINAIAMIVTAHIDVILFTLRGIL